MHRPRSLIISATGLPRLMLRDRALLRRCERAEGGLIGQHPVHARAPHRVGRLTDHGMVLPDHSLQGAAQVTEQMPTIGDMDCGGGALACPLAINISAIAGHNLDAGMATQPSRDGPGIAIRQKIGDRVALQVDNQGAVAPTAAPRPLVEADHAG